ncbi:hypothetical protein LINPERHAP1_LOCUS6253 [Linum perenne]
MQLITMPRLVMTTRLGVTRFPFLIVILSISFDMIVWVFLSPE